MPVSIGVSLGQKHEPTAFCAVEGSRRRRDGSRKVESHFSVRLLERMLPGTPFPKAAERLGQITRGIKNKTRYRPTIFVNATGLTPIIDLLEREVGWVNLVYFNHGDRRVEEGSDKVILGKAWLVARLQALLQTQCLHLPEGAEFRTLAQELLDYEIQVRPDPHELYGAFPVGTQDELVTALGLAVQLDPPLPRRQARYVLT